GSRRLELSYLGQRGVTRRDPLTLIDRSAKPNMPKLAFGLQAAHLGHGGVRINQLLQRWLMQVQDVDVVSAKVAQRLFNATAQNRGAIASSWRRNPKPAANC